MPRSVATARRSTEVNTLDLPLIGAARPASIAVNSDDAQLIDLLFAAIDASGMQRKEAAYLMGYDPAQFSRGQINLGRVGRLPKPLLEDYARRVCAWLGLPVASADPRAVLAHEIGELALALIGKFQMAVMR